MKFNLMSLAVMFVAFSSFAAQESSGFLSVTSAPSALVSAEQSKSTVFHVTMPSDSTLIATVYGGDEISSANENSTYIKEYIDGNNVTFQVSSAGQYSVSAVTKCGLSFSIVINAVESKENPVDIKKFLPKVAIQGASCEAVTTKG
ncbi:hypothetical protein [Idiomarina aminovorans]|uniref:hypothetical protein n=1 Tax=Idiomarina aminovorans TaxID=2914829 RepID=UPI0020041D60|nr:hypothetical protein [Idiomarina sp. ATCH4]MCK7460201.1 hypothetical protein [Idiomarina sp. ATCH4]